MKYGKKIVLSFLAVCLCIFLVPLFSAHALSASKIRVGYYEDGDYMSMDSSGDYVGYNFEYLQQIAKYTGWKYEVVDCGSWENSQSMLKNGEIDILPAVYYTEERGKQLLFSEMEMCSIYTTLNVRANDIRYDYEDFGSFSGMDVGVISDSLDAENFIEYCKDNHIQVNIIPYKETQELLDALKTKKLDAIGITHLGKSSVFRSIAQFSPNEIYFAMPMDHQELMSELNTAMSKIKIRDSSYGIKLYNKYFTTSVSQLPVFTKEEQNYIDTAGTLKAVYEKSWIPLEYMDSETDEYSGMAADIFEKISQNTGLKFEFIPQQSYSDVLKAGKNGTADIVCTVDCDYLWAEENGLITTSYYLRAPIVMISANNGDRNTRIAMPKGHLLTERIIADNPNKTVKYYNTSQECFEALKNNEADLTYADSYVSNFLMSDARYDRFSVITLTNYSEELGIGISKNADSRLFSIIDKCLQYISEDTISDIVLNNSTITQKVSLADIIHQNPLQTFGISLAIFTLIIVVLSYALMMKSKSNKRIQQIMYLDALTHIWNLDKFRLETKKILDKEKNKKYAFIYADISQFKTINDTFGFSEGDWLLCSFAQTLTEYLAEGECCARVSADKFVMLVNYTNWEQLTKKTEMIDEKMNQIMLSENKQYHLILIFGVYVVSHNGIEDISLMIDLANYARRSAKITHKSLTIRYDEKMREEELKRHDMANVMNSALEKGEFRPYFQPKYNMETHELIGSEALVRWFDGEGNMHMPGSFIPFFESNGFIVEIDFFIFEEVCKCIKRWMEEGRTIKPVSSNFSRNHFKNVDFIKRLCDIADKYEVPRNFFELEITESAVMNNSEQIIEYLEHLRKLGFLISIDDFGSGYSSLGMLQHLSVDVIKLDRSFLQKGIFQKREQIIIQGIITVINSLDIAIICEGVETKEQADMLMDMGCFSAQGFYYAKPMPLEEYEKLI